MRWDWCCGSWRPVARRLMVRMRELLFFVDHFDISLCSYISYFIIQIWLTFEINPVWQHCLITRTHFQYVFLSLGLLNKPVTVSAVSSLLSIIGVWSNGTILIRSGQWSRPQGLLWQASLSAVLDGIEWMTDRDAPIERPVIGIGRFLEWPDWWPAGQSHVLLIPSRSFYCQCLTYTKIFQRQHKTNREIKATSY